MVTFLQPFRLVEGALSKPWTATIDQVNRATWDYVELHRVVGGLDVGLPPPFHMVVVRDGALALPALPEERTPTRAVGLFNRSLAALLLGGTYCTAIGLDGLEFGSLIDWKFLRVHTPGTQGPNGFQIRARLRYAGALEAVELEQPRSISFEALSQSMKDGLALLEAAPQLSADLLLKGVTGIARHDWAGALGNLWIVVEQLTSNLWEREVVTPARASSVIPGRLQQLSDTRTWTTGARHELLHQLRVLDQSLLAELSIARKARNNLSHAGTPPKEHEAWAAYQAALQLLAIVAPGLTIPLVDLDVKDHSLSDPFVPRTSSIQGEPKYWLPIPKLPGEEELEREEALVRHPHDPEQPGPVSEGR